MSVVFPVEFVHNRIPDLHFYLVRIRIFYLVWIPPPPRDIHLIRGGLNLKFISTRGSLRGFGEV